VAHIGWPWVAVHPGLPQIRTCGTTAYGSSVTTSLGDIWNEWPRVPEEDSAP
jgi:hypothetical protein